MRNGRCHWRDQWEELAATREAQGGSRQGPSRQDRTSGRGLLPPTHLQEQLQAHRGGCPGWGKGRRWERWKTRGQSLPCHQLHHYETLGEEPLLSLSPDTQWTGPDSGPSKLQDLRVPATTFCTSSFSKLGARKPSLTIRSFHAVFPEEDTIVSVDPSIPTLAEAPKLFLDPPGTLGPPSWPTGMGDGWMGGEGAVWHAGPGVRGGSGKPEEQSWPARLHVSQQLLLPTCLSPTACHRVLPTPDNCKDLDNGGSDKLPDQARVRDHTTV